MIWYNSQSNICILQKVKDQTNVRGEHQNTGPLNKLLDSMKEVDLPSSSVGFTFLHHNIPVTSLYSMWFSCDCGFLGTKLLISQSAWACWFGSTIRCLTLIWSQWSVFFWCFWLIIFMDTNINRWKRYRKDGTKNPVFPQNVVDHYEVGNPNSIIRRFHIPASQQQCNQTV